MMKICRFCVNAVATNAFQKRLDYDAKKINQNCKNICRLVTSRLGLSLEYL